jgi:uncharacterized membrane protein
MAVYTPRDYAIGLTILFVIMWLAKIFIFSKFELDSYFSYAMAPVIVFTIAVRVLADAGVYEKNELWSVTPGIYVTGTVFGVLVILGGKVIERQKNIPYWKGSIALGTPPALYFSFQLLRQMENPLRIFEPVLLALILTALIYTLSNFSSKTKIFRLKDSTLIIFGQMLDGSSTFIGVDKYGFTEEHMLADFLVNTSGTAFVMIPLKIVVVLGALYLLEQWKEEEEGSDLYYNMVKFVFFIFGFGPGTRNSLNLGL